MLLIGGIVSLLSILFLRVWISSESIRLAHELEALIEQKDSLEGSKRKILAQIEELKSPSRISKIAVNKLGMVRSPDTKIIFVEK